jgi:hypothetical protein
MAAKDLINLTRAYQALPAALSGTIDTLLGVLITSVSDAIEKHCRRSFYARTLDEIYDGAAETLQLREYPVQSVTWVRYGPSAVLQVRNTSSANQRASVAVGSSGLTLVRVASGTTTTDTSVTWAGNATINAVATALNALGSGWSAQVVGAATGDYGAWPSADLYHAPYLGDGTQSLGAQHCRSDWAQLKMHVGELSDYAFHPAGYLYRPGRAGFWLPDGDAFTQLSGYWRIKYTAGFTTIPEAVQQAATLWCNHLYHLTLRDNTIAASSVSGNAYSYAAAASPPREVAELLRPFRRVVC